LAIVPTRTLPAPVETGAELTFRPAAVGDARLYAELSLARRPDEPEDPEVARHSWEHPSAGWTRERFILEAEGAPVGYAEHSEPAAERNPEGDGYVTAWLVPRAAAAERLEAAFEFIERRATGAGVRVFTAEVWEDALSEAEAVLARGYRYDRLSKAWELDLIENHDRLLLLAGRTDALLAQQGISCHAIADDPDPEIWARAFAAALDAERDMPRTWPYVPTTFEEYLTWYGGPDSSPRWYFVAKDGDQVVGVSSLCFPPRQGNVWTGLTGVVRSHRGRGIARGVKLAITRQAIEQNVSRIRTDNDETNAPMLHINEELGYQRIPGIVSYRKSHS
jgi:RimJ/RimL family protein N-acetyltransferase